MGLSGPRRRDFSAIPSDDLTDGMGLLARWFRFQPSEIDALDIDDFAMWVEQALKQIEAQAK